MEREIKKEMLKIHMNIASKISYTTILKKLFFINIISLW